MRLGLKSFIGFVLKLIFMAFCKNCIARNRNLQDAFLPCYNNLKKKKNYNITFVSQNYNSTLQNLREHIKILTQGDTKKSLFKIKN